MQVGASRCTHLQLHWLYPVIEQAVHYNRNKILGRNKEVNLRLVVLSNCNETLGDAHWTVFMTRVKLVTVSFHTGSGSEGRATPLSRYCMAAALWCT
jgi:hypothetical protein